MNHTLFSASPFKPAGFNQAVTPLGWRPRMGQFDWRDIVGEIIDPEDLGLSDVENLLEEFDQLITEVPVGSVRDGFSKRRDDCVAEDNLYKRYKCLYDLFQDIKAHLKNGDKGVTPTPTPTPTAKPPEDTFPWVPVGIAAGVGVAALLYFAFRKKK
jgi:hypothetical protein